MEARPGCHLSNPRRCATVLHPCGFCTPFVSRVRLRDKIGSFCSRMFFSRCGVRRIKPRRSLPLVERLLQENPSWLAILSSATSTSRMSATTPSAAKTSLTSFTAAGCEGHSATYRTSTFTWNSPVSARSIRSTAGSPRFACAVRSLNPVSDISGLDPVRLELVRNEWWSSKGLIPLLLYQSKASCHRKRFVVLPINLISPFVQRDAPAMPLLLFQSNFVNVLRQRRLKPVHETLK